LRDSLGRAQLLGDDLRLDSGSRRAFQYAIEGCGTLADDAGLRAADPWSPGRSDLMR
jgi:hypothetical protein